MKPILTITLVLLFGIAKSQDVITMKNGEEVKTKITEITPKLIKYKRFTNLEGATFTINKRDVEKIAYANGEKEVLSESKHKKSNIKESVPDTANMDMATRGTLDANKYYDGSTGAIAGTIIATVGTGVGGLIPAFICSSITPNEDNLNYPNLKLAENKEYERAYKKKAKSIKAGGVWGGFAFGVLLDIALVLVFTGK